MKRINHHLSPRNIGRWPILPLFSVIAFCVFGTPARAEMGDPDCPWPPYDNDCGGGGPGGSGSGGSGGGGRQGGPSSPTPPSNGPTTGTGGVPVGCKPCGGRGGGAGGGGGGGAGGGCIPCGMPVWWISEPLLNLWVSDTPLWYAPSRGAAISLDLSYKDTMSDLGKADTSCTNVFGVGRHWNTPWRSYIEVIDADTNYVKIIFGSGRALLTQLGIIETNGLTRTVKESTNYVVYHRSGAKDVYSYDVTDPSFYTRYFLTRREDPQGNAIRFQYYVTNNITRLEKVIDVDNRETTLTYTNVNGFDLIRQVTSPHGQVAVLNYDNYNSYARLIGITDAVNLTSTMVYAANGSITNIITPYGTNSFEAFAVESDYLGIKVTEYGLRKHFYLRKFAENSGKIPTHYMTDRPSTTNGIYFSFANTFDATNSHERNSFYWSPRQYDQFSEIVRTNLDASSFTFTNLAGRDFRIARQRHWLTDSSGHYSLTLSLERAPSPDGDTQGQITWYDYTGKAGADPEEEGALVLPRFEAWKLPNGESRFSYYEHNALGQATNAVETYADSAGVIRVRTNSMEYATNGIDLITMIDAGGRQISSNSYNGYHQVLTNFNASNEMTVFTYNTNLQILSQLSPGGLTTLYSYHGTGSDSNFLQKVIQVEIGSTNSYTYTNGQIYTHTDERGLTLTNTYDGLLRVRRIDFPGSFITNSYDKLDLVRVVDRMGYTNSFGFNVWRTMIAQTNALGNFTLYNHCNCGALDSIQDAAGGFTYFYYDIAGRLTNTVYADGYGVTNKYSSFGRITNSVDSAGVSVTNWYNNQGLVLTSSNCLGQILSRTYDIEDRVINSVDANGVSIDMVYDELGRMLTRTYPDTGVERFAYSARGLTIYTNQITANVTLYGYNEAGWKTFETNANQEVTQFQYDSSGNLTNLIDGKNQSTKWLYDQYSQVTNKIDHNTSTMFIYRYNANGWLTNRWTPQKTDSFYSYDKVGNLTNVAFASQTNQFRYDAMNRITNMLDAVGATKFTYTAASLLASEDGPWADDTVSYSYQNRKRFEMNILAPNSSAWSQAYGYDGANRLTSVVSPAGSFVYTYQPSLDGVTTASGLIKQIALPNGANITNAFDITARLLKTHLRNSTNALLNSHEYVYNLGNQRTKQTRVDGDYVDYTYDPIGQLKTGTGKELGGTTNRLHEQLGYAYDAAGNLNYRTNNALVQTFNVNGLNQVSNVTRNVSNVLTVAGTTTMPATNVTVNTSNAVLYLDRTFAAAGFTPANGDNTFTAIAKDSLGRKDTNIITVSLPTNGVFAYDQNGNLTNDAAKIFEYDDENQLVRITKTNSWKAEFAYDGKMRRRIERNYEWRNSAWVKTSETRFVYDGNVVVQERNENNSLQVTLTRGKDLSGSLEGAGGIGGLLAFSQHSTPNSQHSYYHSDGNGNVTMLIDVNQLVAAKYIYDPFGRALSKSGALADANRYQFSSKPAHDLSGMYDYLYRWYAPEIQRWVNRDPLGELGFEAAKGKTEIIFMLPPSEAFEGANLYVFVKNRPVTVIDALGLRVFYPFDPHYPPFCPLPKKRDCDNEENWCRVRATIVCGSAGAINKPIGIACAAAYLRVCYLQKKECQKENARNGF